MLSRDVAIGHLQAGRCEFTPLPRSGRCSLLQGPQFPGHLRPAPCRSTPCAVGSAGENQHQRARGGIAAGGRGLEMSHATADNMPAAGRRGCPTDLVHQEQGLAAVVQWERLLLLVAQNGLVNLQTRRAYRHSIVGKRRQEGTRPSWMQSGVRGAGMRGQSAQTYRHKLDTLVCLIMVKPQSLERRLDNLARTAPRLVDIEHCRQWAAT